ncbi:alpha/beta hydrolase [Pontibacter arcticus]|uniref:Alpha/beta hydrolase n=1 Tax=Pontibacter arcticus TaxID=2080288 RepID=A0A364RDH4_9BACT|nr:alpha/beta hydrolase [Pontibacter arcticus]RAU82324.1 alpha/beta hydrolase [Pontibacter arcticus]
MSKIYFISGLGADWRMFQFLDLPEHIRKQHIRWIAPLHPDEPVQEYALRLKEQITEPDPILIGLSFGGLVAIELSKILACRKVIIISSMATRHHLPQYYRVLGKTRLHRWLPFPLMKSIYPVAPFLFGAHTKAERTVLKMAILDIDETFLRWALQQLLAWPQQEVLPGLVQIHGTRDLILPLYPHPETICVPGGEHLMVMHNADQISSILNRILEKI